MATSSSVESIADSLARTLARRSVDPNEAAKVFAHLRAFLGRASQDDAGQAEGLRQWRRWLESVAGPAARTVVRSGRTQEYYAAILDACRAHLSDLPPRATLGALGWAVRLMRYYRGTPAALDGPSIVDIAPAAAPHQPAAARQPAAPPQKPQAPELPSAGDSFVGTVLDVDESAVVIEVPGFAAPQVLGVIKAEALGGRRFREGNKARVEVLGVKTLRNGRTIVELRPAPREASAGPST